MSLLASAAAGPGYGPEPDPRPLVGDRRVLRLLDPVSTPPLLAGLTAYDAGPDPRPERTAVFTVSGWEDGIPGWEPPPRRRTPIAALQRMPNLALCVLMLARGIRGPNAHWVGDGAAVGHVLGLAAQTLSRGAAERALVVAFDPAGPTSCAAVATLLAAGDGPSALPARPAEVAVTPSTATSELDRLRGRGPGPDRERDRDPDREREP